MSKITTVYELIRLSQRCGILSYRLDSNDNMQYFGLTRAVCSARRAQIASRSFEDNNDISNDHNNHQNTNNDTTTTTTTNNNNNDNSNNDNSNNDIDNIYIYIYIYMYILA